MPLYNYKCTNPKCGFEDDVLQKTSDEIITTCPKCKKETFEKQITTNHCFLLSGSGWHKRGMS
jgi:putative FmdB family regulatory protein